MQRWVFKVGFEILFSGRISCPTCWVCCPSGGDLGSPVPGVSLAEEAASRL